MERLVDILDCDGDRTIDFREFVVGLAAFVISGRGLHSSTFQLNLSRSDTKYTLRVFTTYHPLVFHKHPPNNPLYAPPIPRKALWVSRKVDECKPLISGTFGRVRFAFRLLDLNNDGRGGSERKRERRFLMYKEAPGFRPAPRCRGGIPWEIVLWSRFINIDPNYRI